MARGDLAGQTDSFGTYLRIMQDQDTQRQPEPGLAEAAVAPATANGFTAPPVLTILSALDNSSPQPMSQLLEQTRLRISEFARTVEMLKNAQMIAVAGETGAEQAAITPVGHEFLTLGLSPGT